jgi:protein TonB
MKPENILQAELLDILFLNRNKEYGAYMLRKYYNSRLLRSFGITILIVSLLVFGQYIKSHFFEDKNSTLPVLFSQEISLIDAPQPENKKEVVKEIKKPLKQLAQKAYVVPKIVKDDLADKNIPDVEDLDNKLISSIDKDGSDVKNDEVFIPVNDDTKGGEGKEVEPVDVVETTVPLLKAEIMPEFPGGMEAFKKFMMRHLRQQDLNEGEKVIVRVQFVVDAEGSIKHEYFTKWWST